jgi:type IV secretory pathway ATPase VirB11/archaellum biosynthesis ATPase
VVNEISDEVVGFGPIEFLLKDPDVTEVMVNAPDDVFVEREGPSKHLARRHLGCLRTRLAPAQMRPSLGSSRVFIVTPTSTNMDSKISRLSAAKVAKNDEFSPSWHIRRIPPTPQSTN